MEVVIIAVGSELLRFGRRDSNSEWLAEQLQRCGFDVSMRMLVGDDVEAIEGALRHAVSASAVVVVTGGLGPTDDDVTREGLAAACGRRLETDAAEQRRLRELFAAHGRPYHQVQDRQARRPGGATWVENPLGTASGLGVEIGSTRVWALPGVPAEMKAMFRATVRPALPATHGRRFARRTLKVAGRTESSVDLQVRDLYRLPGASVTILTGREGIELHLLTAGKSLEQARERLSELERAMGERLGDDLYARDDESLPAVLGGRLEALDQTVATAESCTAGLLAGAITQVPGSSRWFRGGLVVYSDALKHELAGVPAGLLQEHGAVSEPVARALAAAARGRCKTDYGLAVTGIAGPGGGTPEKPVGLVHVAVAGPGSVDHVRLHLIGDRALIRRRTVVAALDRLRRLLS